MPRMVSRLAIIIGRFRGAGVGSVAL
jgi:hypothetical protein